ncbi:MAG: hypothetical protein KDK70_04850 [Myxococcales bacterium]|nr:hypothetical protein [Myxococcales bacterium]
MATIIIVGVGGAQCAPSSTPPDDPPADTFEGRAVQTVARPLREAGITLDTRKLAVEVKAREQTAADLGPLLELGLRSTHVEVLWQLRTILEATPPFRSVASLREEAVAAQLPEVRVYYAPERRTMVFVDAPQQEQRALEIALAGQMVYAFYDQSPGGLAELLYEPQGLLDGIRVRKCLLEGHARLAELLVRHGRLDGLDADKQAELDSEPRHMHATLTDTPCGEGARYLFARYQAGGWEAVLKAVRSPLPSTEQLMHPSKVDQDFPVNVAVPDWPKDEYGAEDPFGQATLAYEDVLGEQTIYRLLLERDTEPLQARLAAVGWDGDRLRIYEHENGERIVVWRSVWDREVDAEQFATAIAPKGIEPRAFRVRRYGRVVDAISTNGPELAERLHGELAKRPGEPTAQPSDGASTSAIEARLGG